MVVSFFATILLAGTIVASLPIQDADAARASKPKEIVVVGSKVKEVVKSVKLDSCDFHYDSSERINERISANSGGVVKNSDVPSEVETVDLLCTFEDGSTESVEDFALKEKGTTVIHVGDITLKRGHI